MMDEAAIRKRCEQVFRDATGHPSFIGHGGVDLRDVFAAMICAAYADGQRDGMEQARKIAGKYIMMPHIAEQIQGPLTPGEE